MDWLERVVIGPVTIVTYSLPHKKFGHYKPMEWTIEVKYYFKNVIG